MLSPKTALLKTPVDEYRLSEKRKRTGDMFQSLKLGSMLTNGTFACCKIV